MYVYVCISASKRHVCVGGAYESQNRTLDLLDMWTSGCELTDVVVGPQLVSFAGTAWSLNHWAISFAPGLTYF